MKKIVMYFFALANILLFSNAFAHENHYYLIANAGSTGTRLYLFKHNNDNKMPIIESIFSEANTIPLASFGENPEQAYQSLKPLLQKATTILRGHNVETPVPISILGTAGMRLLTTDQQHAIYKNLQNAILNNDKKIFKPENIQTISGKMEGVYGWLDINYLLENFQKRTPPAGSIDIGGTSTEIAFATEKSSKPIDEVSIKINGTNYIVFSKSFLGLGLNEARYSMNADPNAGDCYPKGYKELLLKGSFNLPSCSTVYNQVIDNYHINQLGLPTYKVSNFIAFSGAYYTFHFYGIDTTIPDQDTLEQTIISPLCSNTWESLKTAYPAEPEAYLAAYCANSVFLSNLLFNAFQLQHQQIHIMSKIKENKIDWALGALLYRIIKNET
jgi:hypothetical protein